MFFCIAPKIKCSVSLWNIFLFKYTHTCCYVCISRSRSSFECMFEDKETLINILYIDKLLDMHPCDRSVSIMSLRPVSRLEERKKGYKLSVDTEEARRKREDNMVEIRKNKREESLLKKRREGMQLQSMPPPTPSYSAGDRKVWNCRM